MSKQEEIRHIKSEASAAKSKLIDLLKRVEPLSTKEARSLEIIISRLEAWQTR